MQNNFRKFEELVFCGFLVSGFRIPDSGFRFRIPVPHSGFRFPGFRVTPWEQMSDCHRRVAFLKYALVRSWFDVLKHRMSRNFLGRFYQPGKPLPVFVREDIVDLYNNGVGVSEISRNTRVTKEAVHKVVPVSCNTLPSTARRSHFLVGAVSPY